MARRVVLAYSGGLDTSVAVRWMIENLGVEVICLSADIGQEGTLEGNREKALGAGAIAYEELDLRDEFARDFLAPVIKANALYEGRYPLVSALSRPLIVKHQVELARRYGADGVAHGCTGKGNDQVRFEVSSMALAPDLELIAPVRNWGFTREDSIAYAAAHDIPVRATKEKLYSIDDNLWGRAIECGEMEDPWAKPPQGVWEMTLPVETEPREVTIAFERGVPVAVDGTAAPLHELVVTLNHLVGSYGWGRIDIVENRRVGIKSRETYEAPGALAIMMAHADLEGITLERDLAREKQRIEGRYAELVYDGLWFSPLRNAFDAFVDSSQEHVTGEVRLALVAGQRRRRRSPVAEEPLRLRPRHLRLGGPLPARGLGGVRATVGPRRANVGSGAGHPKHRLRGRMSDDRTAGATGAPLWHGRFEGGPADALWAFTVSLSYDRRLAPYDLAGSRVHAKGLSRAGVITTEESRQICSALDIVEGEMQRGSFAFAPTDEDVHTAIERRVTELAGPAGAKLHTGRSRNDQVATAFRLFVKDALSAVRVGGDGSAGRAVPARRGGRRRLPAGLHAPAAGPARAAGASPDGPRVVARP